MINYRDQSMWINTSQGPYPNYTPAPSYNSKTFASDTYANLINQEYADYQQRFQPYEKQLMSLADSEALLDEQLSRISVNGKRLFDMAQQNSAMMNRRYGIQMDERGQNFNNTQSNLQRGLAISQAKNQSRMANADRQMGILTGAGATRQSMGDY